MGDDTEWLKLPTDDKCVHKVWKARLAGYEEATKLFQTQTEEKSPEFSKYLGLVKKFVTDNNAIAQEKALDAVIAFLENAASSISGRTCSEVLGGVIAKCLNSSRTKTKEKALDIIMLYIEIDKPDIVQEELLKGLENKQPKIVVGCIQALRDALRDFGTKVIKVKPIVKVLSKLLEDRDKNVREETKLLIVEIYRWIGAAIKPQMSHFKPVQVQELEAEFENLPHEKAVQTRFMRSQQDLRAQMEERAATVAAGGGGGSAADEAPAEEIDPYDLMDPVDILSMLPKDFYEKIEAKKWQERREALEAVQRLVENPKLQNGDYSSLVRALIKVMSKDSNVMLVTLAAKVSAGLAIGLRKRFSQFSTNCIQSVLEKFKEKKPTVVAALREAIDASYASTTLEPISEDILAALENKNPSIKAETSLFLARCFAKATMATLPKKQLKNFCTVLCKTINDTAPDVREASYEALGTAMRAVGEKPLTPFIADVDSIKLAKIKEYCEKAVLLNARGEPRAGAAPVTKAAPAAKAPEKPKPVQRPPSRSSAAKPAAKTASKSGGASKKVAGKKDKKRGVKEEVEENILADEVVEEKVAALLPADTLTQLVSSNWKERLSAMEKFTQIVKGMTRDEIPAQVFIRTLSNKPGLKDTNFQVLKLKVELVAHLAQNSVFSKRSASFCMVDLVDKLGDAKNGKAAQEAFSCIAEATSLEYVATEVIHLAFEQKNPKNQAEALNWLSNALKEFGFKMALKPVIENIKKAFGATNPAVRTAAVTLVSVLFMYMGANLRVFFDGEKAALLQQIDAEFEKVKDQKPPAPTRGLSPKTAGEEDDEEAADDEAEEPPSLADLVPRTDISEKITEELQNELSDKNWKVRAEGLQKVTAILNEAKFVTCNIGQLPDALKTRLGDSNKILATTALGICQTLGSALGPHCKVHVKTIGPGLVTCMGDSKTQARAAAVNAMNVWVEHSTLLPFVEAEVLSDALKLENPNLRSELLGWLAEKLPPHKQLPVELRMCVPHVLSCLEDRNGEVRKKAQEALVPFMIHTGYESFQKATNKLKPASKDQIMGIIEKARANIPPKPSKRPATAKVPAAAPPPQPEVRDEDDDEVESISASGRPASSSGGAKGKPRPGSAKPGSKAPPPTTKKKKEEEDMSPSIIINVSKESRFKDEKALKVLKWNFTEPRLEFVDQLKLQMEKNFNKSLMAQMYHADFKQHVKAIESLMKLLEMDMEATAANLDLLLRWLTLRFFDTNPSMLNKALEYLKILFTALAEMDYHLTESEAVSFIPYLVNKVGDPKDNVRKDVRVIFKLICKVFPASKMFSYILDGLKAKNAKLRTECLDELGCLVEVYGVNVCQPSPAQALKLIAQQIGDRDNCVRSAALNTLVSAYLILGEQIYKFVGHLKDKDQSLLEERIKRSGKNKPAAMPAGQTPVPVKGQQRERPKSGPPPSDRIDHVMAGMPKSASSQSMHKGTFSLEVEEVDFNEVEVKLIALDCDDMLKETVELPKTNRARPNSPTKAVLGTSNDAASAIGLVISQISNADTMLSIQALAQVDEVLKDKEKCELMVSHIDQLLLTMSMQLKMVYSKHMGDEMTLEEDVMKRYRTLLGTVLDVFQNKTLAKQASKDILKDLLGNLVTVLLDSRLEELDDGPQIIRTVNVMIVKIVGKADPTTIMGAVIKLLQECMESETCSKKYMEIVMKCIWKTIRMLPEFIDEINLDRVLLDTHLFLKAFPPSYWKERSTDMPYRTMKTIIHTLCKLVGNKILAHTGLIDQANSEVLTYVNKVLNNSDSSTTSNNSKNEQMNGLAENKTPRRDGKTPRRLSKSTHEVLVEIFKKIGSKENSKEGLNDLYDFKKKHPEADLDPFLRKSSTYFQHYVERGLKSIEQEREGKLTQSNAGTGNVLGNSNPSAVIGQSGNAETDSGAYYREKLRVLRARCGLDNNAEAPVDNVESTEEEKADNTDNPELTTANVLELKKRLERIKKMAKN